MQYFKCLSSPNSEGFSSKYFDLIKAFESHTNVEKVLVVSQFESVKHVNDKLVPTNNCEF